MKFAYLVALLIGATSSIGQAAIPLESFAKLATYDQLALSPSGEYLAISTPIEDQTGLAIVRLADMQLTGSLRLTHDFHVSKFNWVGPERLLIELAQKYGALDVPQPTGELYTINAFGKEKKYLFGFRGAERTGSHIKKVTREYASARTVDLLPAQPDHALIAIDAWGNGLNGYSSVERIDLRTGKRNRVLSSPAPGISGFATDLSGTVRYAVAMTENLSGVQTFKRSAQDTEWEAVSRGRFADATIVPVGVWKDRALLASNEAGDRLCLVEHNLLNDRRKTIVCDKTVDFGGLIRSFDAQQAIAAIFHDGRPSYRFLNSGHAHEKELRDLAGAFGGEFVQPVSASADGNRVVLRVSSDRNPGEFFLFDRKTGAVKFLIAQRAWIKADQMAAMQPKTFKARDGTTLHGYLTLPQAGKPRGLVVIPHGGPLDVRDHWSWSADVQMLASRGYAVLQVNFRGSGGYGAKFRGAGRYAWGTTMINDINDATRQLRKDPQFAGSGACIMGGSYGGYAAVMAAIREPGLYRCVVAEAGVYDLVEWRKSSDVAESRFGRNYIEDQIGRNDVELKAQSPLTYIDRLKAAVLIIHGKEDRRVPFSQAERLRKALKQRRHAHEWVAVRGEGHGFYELGNRLKRLQAIEKFLKRHL